METVTSFLGETIDIETAARDADGVAIVLDGTWSAACRITRDRVGGTLVAEPVMTIADGVARGSIDTRDEGWAVGTYVYDVRLTNAAGDDFWTEPVKLKLEARNSPASTEVTP